MNPKAQGAISGAISGGSKGGWAGAIIGGLLGAARAKKGGTAIPAYEGGVSEEQNMLAPDENDYRNIVAGMNNGYGEW